MAQFNLSITLEYDIITAQDDITLATKVNERLQSGNDWEPLGGVISHRGVLCQAIVREKPKVYKHDFELGWQLDTPSP